MKANIEVSAKRGIFTAIGYALVKPKDGKRERVRDRSRIKQDAIDACRVELERQGYEVEEVHKAVAW